MENLNSSTASKSKCTDQRIKVMKAFHSKREAFRICFGLILCSTMISSIKCDLSESTVTTPAPSTGGEYFTSIVKMKELARFEQSLVAEMKAVVKNFNTTNVLEAGSVGKPWHDGLSKIKSYLHDYDSSISPMLNETDSVENLVVYHPLISFRTLRRVAVDLPNILQYNVEGRLENLTNVVALIQPAVTLDDVIGAMEGILRLHSTFLISPYDFAHGRLRNIETKSGLTDTDCFLIGTLALNQTEKMPLEAVAWLLQSLRMFLRREDNVSTGMISIEMVRQSLRSAIELHNKEVVNQNPFTFGKVIGINLSEMTQDNENDLMKTLPPNPPLLNYQLFTEAHSVQDVINFRGVCGGVKLRNETLTKNLVCYYKTDNPFLTIKPLKVEVHSYDPLIMQFYDLVPDSITNHFINTTSHRLQRALVASDTGDGRIPSKGRIACSYFHYYEKEDEILRRVPQIVHEATDLNVIPTSASEFSQVSTYGSIGGFYAQHYDTLHDDRYLEFQTLDDDTISRGDRIATIMFYLTDVKLGGGTAFPKIGVLAEPVKGSAVFWYNLKKNGKRHDHTLHGGCPVLLGEKWVVNKWIHSGDQMFLRKCSLDSNV